MQHERRHDRQQRGKHDDDRRVPGGEPRDKRLRTRFFRGGIFDQLQYLADRGLRERLLHFDLQHAVEVDAAGVDDAARPDTARDGLSRQRGGVEPRVTAAHRAVERDALARVDEDRFAHGDVFRRDFFAAVVRFAACRVGTDRHQFLDRAAGTLDRHVLEQLPDLIKEHDRHGFRIFPHGERADRGKRHQEVFIEQLAVQQVASRFPQYAPADEQVPC